MSSRDSNAAAFVARKLLSDDVAEKVDENRLANLVEQIWKFNDLDYRSARTEANNLLPRIRIMTQGGRHSYVDGTARIKKLCDQGGKTGLDWIIAREGTLSDTSNRIGNGRTSGFVSSRTRNAALMMAQFPKVDLFIPSVVDFYEGLPESYSDPTRQMQFYTALTIISQGRFLPMVSFHPERYFEEKRDRHAFNNLDLVKNAIEIGGAIGVKVHPSSGFDPLSNADYAQLGENPDKYQNGCHIRSEHPSLNAEKYEVMDEAMHDLFELCSKLEVPILTHSGTSISSASKCMYGASNLEAPGDYITNPQHPNDWTNSTHHWSMALNDPELTAPNARVALAHFAGGFGQMKTPTNELVQNAESDKNWFSPNPYDYDGNALQTTDWLETAINHIKNSTSANMYIDTSVMDELAYSQAVRENILATGKVDDGPWKIAPGIRLSSRSAIQDAKNDGGKFAKKFSDFVKNTPAVHDRLLYGSDLHMQSVATVSAHDAYLDLIEAAIPDEDGLRDKVMGGNAATFFGLRSGEKNRGRIEEFMRETGTDPQSVRWMQKLDALESA